MYQVSALYNSILSGEHSFECALTFRDSDNQLFTISESDIFSVSTEYKMFSGETPEAGACVASEMTLTILNKFDIPRRGRIRLFVRAHGTTTQGTSSYVADNTLYLSNFVSVNNSILTFSDGSQAAVIGDVLGLTNATGAQVSEWIPQGIFFVDTREVTHNSDGVDLMTLHAYDAMLMTEADYPDTTHAWPTTDSNVINEIASTIGVSVDTRTWDLIDKNYSINLPVGYSMREVLENIGAMYGGNWIMSYEGELLFVGLASTPMETNYLVDNNNNAITFGGVRILV